MRSAEVVAFDLLARIRDHLGHVPPIDQIDFEPDAPTGTVAAYVYFVDGACEVLPIFDPPSPFDGFAIASAMVYRPPQPPNGGASAA